MKHSRSAWLLLLLLVGCVGAHRVPVRTAEVYDGPLYADGEVVQVRLGGPEASEPFVSLNWIPSQVTRKTLGGLPAPSSAGHSSINLLDAATITWGASGNDLIRSTAGFVEIPNLYVTNAFTVPVMIDFAGAGAGMTNSGVSAPVLSNDVDGTCIGNGTGTNCDGVTSAATYGFYNCVGCTITSDGSNISFGSGGTFAQTLYALNIGVTTGAFYMYITDSTASPGAAIINKECGKSAVASGASSVVITNSKHVATTGFPLITPLSDTANCRGAYATPGNGSFTVTCPGGNAGANWSFAWCVINKGD